MNTNSIIERKFIEFSGLEPAKANIPFIVVDNFPRLGLMTALRFLEWVNENPDGVISLPTGKTPEYFIMWTKYLLENWDSKKGMDIRAKYGLDNTPKPLLSNLQFVQIDEFYPISSEQHNSFYNYVNKYYLKDFGLDPKKALLINSDTIALFDGKHFKEVFPDYHVDLTLRYREPSSSFERQQQLSIFTIDDWCSNYESQVRDKGGIGFFLGGIGPDGHIAFNTRGSDHQSTTRLTSTNFETQAVAAGDLGGIEVSRNRLVITIGLKTITYNPDVTALIFAAGEAKAPMVKDALEQKPSNLYPATVLAGKENARFYLTSGAATMLESSLDAYFKNGEWTQTKTDRAVIELCRRLGKYAHHLTLDDLKDDKHCKMIPGISENTVSTAIESIQAKIERGMKLEKDQVFYHTGPHHDDIMLAILPHIHRSIEDESNRNYFSVLTSGFTAVTNQFLIEAMKDTKKFLDQGLIQMTEYADFFESGFKHKRDKDVYHYLIKVASGEAYELRRGLAHRIVRAIVETFKVRSSEELWDQINEILHILRKSYDGEKNPSKIQKLKGMIREFEEELVWAYLGVDIKDIHHLRLGFYTGDIFTEQPQQTRDVEPVLKELRNIKPSVISLAFDPEGSGPDTHYKVLQVIADAIRSWKKEEDLSKLRIWGYRNVWYRFHPAEANVIVPVSLNDMGVMEKTFENSYLSQVDASFPSYQHDGKFSELSQKIWVSQLKILQLLLGKKYFYQNVSPRLRSTHGLLFFREMNVDEFLQQARELEKSMEGILD